MARKQYFPSIELEVSAKFTGATGVNQVLIPDNLANALEVLNANSDSFLKFISTTDSLYVALGQRITIPAGSAALPSISKVGDLNTGVWFPAADTIAISVGGSEAMRIKSTGHVGIGITSPDGTLHVYSSTAGVNASPHVEADDLIVESDGATGMTLLGPDNAKLTYAFGNPATSGSIAAFIRWNYDDGLLEFSTNKAGGEISIATAVEVEAIRIDSSGVVSIASFTGSGDVTTNASKEMIDTSDKRLKKHLGNLEDGAIERVMQWQPVYFAYKSDLEKDEYVDEEYVDEEDLDDDGNGKVKTKKVKTGKKRFTEEYATTLGFYSQDINPISPKVAPHDTKDDKWGFSSRAAIAELTKMNQEQQVLIQELTARTEALETV